MRFLIIFISLLCLSLPAHALEVTGIRFGSHPDKQRIVIEMSENAAFKAYAMQNPDRLILDLPRFDWKVGNIQKPVSSLIQDIRHGGIGNNMSRLVLETSGPTRIVSFFAIPKDAKQPDRIVIDFQKSSSTDAVPAPIASGGGVRNLADQLPPELKKAEAERVALRTSAYKKPEPAHQRQPVAKTGLPEIEPAAETFPDTPSFDEKPRFRNNQKPLIILDPGHGGQDPGARAANGAYEKTIVLAVALELKNQLENSGQYRVQMTRDTDIFIPLRDRVKFAKRNGGDLFISLHADSMSNASVTGASVYTLSNTASDKETAKLAERENKSDAIAGVNLSGQDNDVANILIDLASRDTMNQSRYLANVVVATLPSKGVTLLPRKPHRSAGFAVLKAVDIPSILVEMGYLTNMEEANRLSTKEYRSKVAKGLKASIDAYFTKVAKLGND